MDLKLFKNEVASHLHKDEVAYGEILFNNCDCQILSQSAISIDFLISSANESKPIEYSLLIEDASDDDFMLVPKANGKIIDWDRYSYACLLQYEQELSLLDPKEKIEHKQYTRQGMINRVLAERRQKADSASYRIRWANNVYGDHILTNERGVRYKVFLRDFDAETGYSDSWDSRLNKLGTTKHIMYAFSELRNKPELFEMMDKTYPFIEIFCDPLNEYKITWHYPHKMNVGEQLLISRYFKKLNYIENNESEIKSFLGFIEKAEDFETICIRPEVRDKVERAFEQSMLRELGKNHKHDYSLIKTELFPYQKEGVEFALFKKAAIIADEMGLGKTVQAAAVAVLKKQVFDFRKTLVVCPATLKSQWKKEIEAFTHEKALIVSGTPKERESQYLNDSHYFYIINYETVMRDNIAINKAGMDFLILDEAQKIKNFETKTFSAIKRLLPKHTLIITGTPIENRLIDIFSIVSVLDPYFFGPLWEFSYQHCLFDVEKTNKINGYYNLQALNAKLSEILIRREKRNVLDQIPNVQQLDIHVELSRAQAEYHASYAKALAKIIQKKFLTAFDLQRMQLLLSNMRMVCDSTYLIDEATNVSPKLEELEHILIEQLDLRRSDRKVIIFSEWIKVHKLIGQMLRQNKIGFVELSGKVPVKSRGELIKKFENTPECQVFLSTEAGGAGLNLQIANTLINFELPWNPAKKNQRIGRIDRLGQKSGKLTIFNLITRNSIEQQIAAGLLVKQNLFEGVLDGGSNTDYVDFSSKGRSQFITQLESFVNRLEDERDYELVEAQGAVADADVDAVAELDADMVAGADDTIIDTHENILARDDGLTDDLESASVGDAAAADAAVTATDAAAQGKRHPAPADGEIKAVELEHVMNSGMQFLAGLFKMSTGKDLGLESQRIDINKETGEVTMTFKLLIFADK